MRDLPDGEEKDELKGQIVELAREALQLYDAVQAGEIQEPKLEMQYGKYGEKVCQELISLKDYSADYSFLPSSYKPKSYTDPSNNKKEYVLDEAAQEKYRNDRFSVDLFPVFCSLAPLPLSYQKELAKRHTPIRR